MQLIFNVIAMEKKKNELFVRKKRKKNPSDFFFIFFSFPNKQFIFFFQKFQKKIGRTPHIFFCPSAVAKSGVGNTSGAVNSDFFVNFHAK